MGDPRTVRESVRALELMIPECYKQHAYIIHDASLPVPEFIKDIQFDLIVLGPTFLAARCNDRLLDALRNSYDFLRGADACKVALPQDEYDCTGYLENLLLEWGVNLVYTVLPSHAHLLYPRLSRCTEVRRGYTGYIDNSWIDQWKEPKAMNQRKIRVSYRARQLSYNFGELGQLKTEIAAKFKNSLPTWIPRESIDISTHSSDTLYGDRWHKFLEDSQSCLVTPSGSSILDKYGYLRGFAHECQKGENQIDYFNFKEICLLGQQEIRFSALSPRNIEAALANTIQIGTFGDYSDLMNPGRDYILLNEDCSNISQVFEVMDDKTYIERVQKNCKDNMLSEPRLRRKNMAHEILEFAGASRHRVALDDGSKAEFKSAISRYSNIMHKKYKLYWALRRSTQRLLNN